MSTGSVTPLLPSNSVANKTTAAAAAPAAASAAAVAQSAPSSRRSSLTNTPSGPANLSAVVSMSKR